LSIRPATLADVAFIVSLGTRESLCVGWLPRMAVTNYVSGYGRVWCAVVDGLVVGYLVSRRLTGTALTCCIQIAIEPAFRRSGIGRVLVAFWHSAERVDGCGVAQAWVKSDLEAMSFFRAVGMDALLRCERPTQRGVCRTLFRCPLIWPPPDDWTEPPKRTGWKAARLLPVQVRPARDIADRGKRRKLA